MEKKILGALKCAKDAHPEINYSGFEGSIVKRIAKNFAWQPIETAPKDGTLIDVNCISPNLNDKRRVRLTGVSWYNADDIFPHTGWVRVVDDGNYDLIDSTACCRYGLPRWIPTHWMPLPEPPKDE